METIDRIIRIRYKVQKINFNINWNFSKGMIKESIMRINYKYKGKFKKIRDQYYKIFRMKEIDIFA